MAWTITNEVNKAALDGITALLNGGSVLMTTSADAELAAPALNATAFGAATTATPAVATANALTADSSVTPGTWGKVAFRTSGGAARISGTVGVGTGDFQVADNVIPGTAVSATLSSLTFSLTITG